VFVSEEEHNSTWIIQLVPGTQDRNAHYSIAAISNTLHLKFFKVRGSIQENKWKSEGEALHTEQYWTLRKANLFIPCHVLLVKRNEIYKNENVQHMY
jgi:hypothetical protein